MDITSWDRPVQLDSKERVINIINEKMPLLTEVVRLDHLLFDDLGTDELDSVEIIMEVEKEFNIAIPDVMAQDYFYWTVSDLIRIADPNYIFEDDVLKPDGYKIPDNPPSIYSLTDPQFQNTLDEDIKIQEHTPFEIIKGQRLLTTLRRFQVGITTVRVSGVGLFLGNEGDILEEIYDKPNHFINITHSQIGNLSNELFEPEIISLKSLNQELLTSFPNKMKEPKKSIFPQPKKYARIQRKERNAYEGNERVRNFIINKKLGIKSLTALESINVMDSALLEKKRKKTGQAFNRKMKKLAEINEDLTIMRMILGIESED